MKTVNTAYGPCKFYGKDEYIGRSLYNYGEWSGEECEKIVSLAAGRDSLDIGANIGFMSMALVASGCSVVSFEPQPELYRLLVENAVGASCKPIALSSFTGKALMPRIRYGSKGNYGGLAIGTRSELGTIQVDCDTLDNLGLRADFIKIDVEGHETEVLIGGRDTITRDKPVLYIEDDRDDKRASLYKELSYLGYQWEDHNPPMYRSNNYLGLKKNIWGTHYISKNIICWK